MYHIKHQKTLRAINLLLSDCCGIYIPKDFYNEFDFEEWHIDETKVKPLSDCYSELYWHCWDYVLDNAYYLDDNGNKFVVLGNPKYDKIRSLAKSESKKVGVFWFDNPPLLYPPRKAARMTAGKKVR